MIAYFIHNPCFRLVSQNIDVDTSNMITGEKGPFQGLLRKEGSSDNVMALFPELDYLTSCDVVDNIDMDVILNN